MPVKKRIYKPYKYDIETCYRIYHEYKDNPIVSRKEIATKYNITEKTLKNWEDSFENGNYQQIYDLTKNKKHVNSSDRRRKQQPAKKNNDEEFFENLMKNRNPITGDYISQSSSVTDKISSDASQSDNTISITTRNKDDNINKSNNNVDFVKKNNGKKIKVVSLHSHDEYLNNIIDKNNK